MDTAQLIATFIDNVDDNTGALDDAITAITRRAIRIGQRERLPPIPLALEWIAASIRGDDANLIP